MKKIKYLYGMAMTIITTTITATAIVRLPRLYHQYHQ